MEEDIDKTVFSFRVVNAETGEIDEKRESELIKFINQYLLKAKISVCLDIFIIIAIMILLSLNRCMWMLLIPIVIAIKNGLFQIHPYFSISIR